MLTSTKKTLEFRVILGSGASICSMYYVWVRSCRCGDPSRDGTQDCSEAWGPRMEMRRKPRYHEVGISHMKTSQSRGSVVCIVQALFLRRRSSMQDIMATLYIMAGGRICLDRDPSIFCLFGGGFPPLTFLFFQSLPLFLMCFPTMFGLKAV